MFRIWVSVITLVLCQYQATSQCVNTISTFPYVESFENNTGGWVSGGMNSDWAWGIPNKTYINNAGQGQRCWVTGGLNGSFYSYGQRSFVYSPCFNFSTLQNPYIEMKIWWEGENQYDGTTFQYSLNNGQTWTNVGSVNEPVNCLNEHWFNTANITALNTLASPQQGWSGTVQATQGTCFGGNGIGNWVTAKHCLSNLSGQASVMFRFAFGAGTICNDFNGFAFDDIRISEAPAAMADFTFQCTANPLEYQFINSTNLCPDVFQWQFGDPNSGQANTASGANATHMFTTPGSYTVTLTVQGPCGQTSSVSKTINTLTLNVLGTNPTCNDNNGQITAVGTNMTGNGIYTLNPGLQSNATGVFTNLNVGTYTIILSDAAACSLTKTIVLTAPSSATWTNVSGMDIRCYGGADGLIQANANGGVGSLSYTIQPGNTNNNTGLFTQLEQGTYTVTATDASNCILTTTVILQQPNALSWVQTEFTRNPCGALQIGYFTLKAQGGTGAIAYGIYPMRDTNSIGIFPINEAGVYKLEAFDQNQCTLAQEVQVLEQDCCAGAYLPNAFTPNNDGNNDEFRIVNFFGANIEAFKVYNRWGQAVFTAQHNEDRWDGKFKGMACEAGTYFYVLEYTCLSNGKLYRFTGDISLIR